MNIDNYIIPIDNLDLPRILSTWTWLTGDDKSIIRISKAGDVLLKNETGQLFFLDTGNGTIDLISYNYIDFINNQTDDNLLQELFLPELIDHLNRSNIKLNLKQVYSYTTLPILGGCYDDKNMFALDIYEHFGLTGEIHFKIKDRPDGTKFEIRIE